jgi:predicted alpha-1,6-mannanase (GH76 family)
VKWKPPVFGLITVLFCSVWTPAQTVSQAQADLAMQAFNKTYWNATGKYFHKQDNRTGVLDFWMSAPVWETVMDAYVRTGKDEYKQQIKDMYDGFVARQGLDWTRNDYNDDIMWWVLACLHAHGITGEARYLTQAKSQFDWVYRTQQDTVLGGGIWWKNTDRSQKNSCIVQPAVISAALLAQYLKDDGYRVKAESLYAWQKRTLVEPTGKVYDRIDQYRVVAKGSTTYNQGTYIGAAIGLARIPDAKKGADWTKANMCNTAGIFREAGQGDFGTFKLICVRYAMQLAKLQGGEAYLPWMEANAAQVWAQRRVSDNIMGFDWNNPAPVTGVECQSAAGGVALLNLLAKTALSINPLPAAGRSPEHGEAFAVPGGHGMILFPAGKAGAGMGQSGFRRLDGRTILLR